MIEIFEHEKVDIYLKSYNTFSNRVGESKKLGGIIEVLKNTHSRTDIGQIDFKSLLEYFKTNFHENTS